jgi:DNA-directed DNA polymerase III PolC
MLCFARTYYSLRYGTLSPEELAKRAGEAGYTRLALVDINNTTGLPDTLTACHKQGIGCIAGVDVRNGNEHLYTLLAANHNGLQEIHEMLTDCHLRRVAYPPHPPSFANVLCVYPYSRAGEKLPSGSLTGILPSESTRFSISGANHPAIAYYPFSMASSEDYNLHLNLRAIDENLLLSRLQPSQTAPPAEALLSFDKLKQLYSHSPELLSRTGSLLSDFSINFDFKSVKNKKHFTTSRYDDKILLEKLAREGCEQRYGKHNAHARERVSHELDIIDRLGFSAYFLITWDTIRYSMSCGFYHVGRGSGANSVVAYCLRITDVDPIELDLYFERFINPKRSSPPDFDIDYSWKERDRVIDYLFKRYGGRHTALLGAMSTFRGKSIYRELGKVHGLPKADIDELVRNPAMAAQAGSPVHTVQSVAGRMLDFPNIRSIHAGGVLVSEEPITRYAALDLPPKGFPTTQWDMYVAEDLGYEKLDILSQRGIGHIRDCADIVLQNRGIKVDVHRISDFKKDPTTLAMLKNAETSGCFYIESPAMRGLLRKLRCSDYITLVAASSIVRPGVAKSGMMKEYIHRFHNPNAFEYIHPVMKEQLKETYGVMVYQEDVLKVCHHFAGLDLADADVLRRAMSGKTRSKEEFQRIVEKFFYNCRERGYPENIAKEVWRQIESFGGYSFSKAHSASYAVESFQSLWLKAHYPLEFITAVINNFGGFYQTWVYFQQADRLGAQIELPCVNHSNHLSRLTENRIYIGFVHMANLETRLAQFIEDERNRSGAFASLSDFVSRVPVSREQLLLLIRINAFRFTGIEKPLLIWQAHAILGKEKPLPEQKKLFAAAAFRNYELPAFQSSALEHAYDEIELQGWPVSLSWFDMLQTAFRGEITASEMMMHTGRKLRMLGLLVTIKYVRTTKGDLMNFGTFLDCKGEFFDTVHFADSLKNYPFRGSGLYLILGIITQEFGQPSVHVEKLAKLPLKPDPRGG